jgi:mRNA interferase RelE/StbE
LKTHYRKRFLKELARIPSNIRINIEQYVFIEIPSLDSITKSKKIERMKGYRNCYKIRFGDYRIGMKIEDDIIIFERALHCREIYRYFP